MCIFNDLFKTDLKYDTYALKGFTNLITHLCLYLRGDWSLVMFMVKPEHIKAIALPPLALFWVVLRIQGGGNCMVELKIYLS